MSKIRGKNTKPEILLRSALFKLGYRFRIHRKNLPGKPDIIFPKYKIAIFVHGCFWHYHKDCREGRIPSTNTNFWENKLKYNITKDKRNYRELKKLGWTVIVIWECEIEKNLSAILTRIISILRTQ